MLIWIENCEKGFLSVIDANTMAYIDTRVSQALETNSSFVINNS